jgi:membrane protein YqaA with SNARE-associated domain
LAGAVGNFLAFQAGFLAGRKLGRPLLERRPHWTSRVEKVQGWLKRYQVLIVGIRFMAGFDTVGTVPIGMSDVSLQRFTVLNGLGAFMWAATLAAAGYLLGNILELVLGDLATIEKPLLIGIVVLTVGRKRDRESCAVTTISIREVRSSTDLGIRSVGRTGSARRERIAKSAGLAPRSGRMPVATNPLSRIGLTCSLA